MVLKFKLGMMGLTIIIGLKKEQIVIFREIGFYLTLSWIII